MWEPSAYDLEWSRKLFDSLKDGGIWKFSTGVMGTPVGSTNATFTKRDNGMILTDIHIENIKEQSFLIDRINKAERCFTKLGIPCEIENCVETAFLDMVSGK